MDVIFLLAINVEDLCGKIILQPLKKEIENNFHNLSSHKKELFIF